MTPVRSEPISDHYSTPPNQGARNLELAHNNVVCAVYDIASTASHILAAS